MHHHHLPQPTKNNVNVPTSTSAAGNATTGITTQQQRRRKKRPNYGTRTLEVRRGFSGFGFTISGQQPCRLSCIVSNSPADQAGLRAGDFLISVNGLNVSKLPHETVVQLIGNSFGSIRMQIAENYYSDSSDEENATLQQNPHSLGFHNISGLRYLHHKTKLHRMRNSPQKKRGEASLKHKVQIERAQTKKTLKEVSKKHMVESLTLSHLSPLMEDLPLRPLSVTNESTKPCSTPAAVYNSNVANVSAMVRVPSNALEYRAVVGYLGTIEMPKQISQSSKLQTVRSCIRKLRQEKRQPSTVLMIILPDSLRLQASNGTILATYASSRLSYVSSSSESENRFFGLVTSAVHSTPLDEDNDEQDNEAPTLSSSVTSHITISNSCHVFVVDTKLCEHQLHLERAQDFHIECTKDLISSLCLEFPSNSEYVVNLIRSMYTMRILPPATQRCNSGDHYAQAAGGEAAHSPQPSNHSEISTTTSNSDSGIGFHNDCRNISDRIVVVDFPQVDYFPIRSMGIQSSRPMGIFQRLNLEQASSPVISSENKRLSVRALADTVSKPISSINGFMTTRSCDDVLSLLENDETVAPSYTNHQHVSVDDIPLHNVSLSGEDRKSFLHPSSTEQDNSYLLSETLAPNKPRRSKQVPDKLSPQVYDLGISIIKAPKCKVPAKNCTVSECKLSEDAFTILNETSDENNGNRNLQDLPQKQAAVKSAKYLELVSSEPDLCASTDTSFLSQRRSWMQSSLRTIRSDKHTANRKEKLSNDNNICLLQRSVSLSEKVHNNDLEEKHMTPLTDHRKNEKELNESTRVSAWATSFVNLLEDPLGVKTFAEFLRLEYSAENIYFWTACERFRHIESEAERIIQAKIIFAKHLSEVATEPVNVDSQARNAVEKKLRQSADVDVFAVAQKQIFNLMKYDSYQRFIRSDLYKKTLQAQERGECLPYEKDNLDDLLKTNFTSDASTNLKKSASNAEDRRRKSLLPWHRKMRRKSRELSEENAHRQVCKNFGLKNKSQRQTFFNDLHGSRSSLSSYDASIVGSAASLNVNTPLCRVKLPDGSTTIIQIQLEESVGELVKRILEKRGLNYRIYEVFVRGLTTKPINLQTLSQEIAGKEVEVEQRVAFKLDLPDFKVISVKSKPRKTLHEVMKPILQKYNYQLEDVETICKDTKEKIDLHQHVVRVDGQRLQVLMKTNKIKFVKPLPVKANIPIVKGINAQITLDEMTNTVFKNLMEGKLQNRNYKKSNDLNSLKSNDCDSHTSSISDRIRSKRRDSANLINLGNMKTKKKLQVKAAYDELVPFNKTISNNLKGANCKLPFDKSVAEKMIENQDELLEGLKRAQLARLEDQRGTEINFELPDFLKNKENLLKSLNRNTENTSKNKCRYGTYMGRPQPAPRLSITNKNRLINADEQSSIRCNSEAQLLTTSTSKSPPPLPPKPKVLPIKPSNWGVATTHSTNSSIITTTGPQIFNKLSKTTEAVTGATINKVALIAAAYLEEPSSSFV
uniref:Regulator of G-protein signaling loco n=1 Tax=Glossina brevipalpis TaxID=37001 RepID=A0A1A9WWQ9_9MUSC